MSNAVEKAKLVLEKDLAVLYGFFGVLDSSGFFPPREFLNEFLRRGLDPCDQDGRMEGWTPFTLSDQDYQAVRDWWTSKRPGARVDALGANCWDDWAQKVINR
jgi:hypothetical protein